MATIEELKAQRAALTKQIDAIRSESRAQAIVEIKRLLEEHGLTVSDVATASTKNPGAAKVAGRKVAATAPMTMTMPNPRARLVNLVDMMDCSVGDVELSRLRALGGQLLARGRRGGALQG